MPVDPTISLGVTSPAAPANPLGVLGGFADIQNKLNEVQLFRQTFAARQKAGQILAASPDLDTGLRNLMSDPLTAPFSGEIVNQARQGLLAQAQYQGEVQHQAQDGFTSAMKAMSAGLADPSMLPKVIDAQKKLMSPLALERDGPALDSVSSSLLDGLPTDEKGNYTPDAKGQFQKRLAALNLSAGVTPEVVFATGGTVPPQVAQTTGPGGEAQTRIIGGFGGPQGGLGQGAGGGAGVAPAGNALAPGLVASGPSASRTEELKGIGASGADVQKEMVSNAEVLPTQLARLNTITDALGKFQAGGFANMRVEGAKFLQGLKNAGIAGISDNDINAVANSSLPDSQIFNSLIKQFVTRQLSADVKGQGRAMQTEVQAYLDSMDSTTDPRALLPILNLAKYSMQVGYDKSQKFLDFKKALASGDPSVKGLDLADFDSFYNKNFGGKSSLPSGNAGGGLNLAPATAESIKGASPASAVAPTGGITHRYIPGKGIVPIGTP